MARINNLLGMNNRDIKKLHDMLNINVKSDPENEFLTVSEYINIYKPKTEKRISKNGTELVKVFYHDGTIKEYPVQQIKSTCCFFRPCDMKK